MSNRIIARVSVIMFALVLFTGASGCQNSDKLLYESSGSGDSITPTPVATVADLQTAEASGGYRTASGKATNSGPAGRDLIVKVLIEYLNSDGTVAVSDYSFKQFTEEWKIGDSFNFSIATKMPEGAGVADRRATASVILNVTSADAYSAALTELGNKAAEQQADETAIAEARAAEAARQAAASSSGSSSGSSGSSQSAQDQYYCALYGGAYCSGSSSSSGSSGSSGASGSNTSGGSSGGGYTITPQFQATMPSMHDTSGGMWSY